MTMPRQQNLPISLQNNGFISQRTVFRACGHVQWERFWSASVGVLHYPVNLNRKPRTHRAVGRYSGQRSTPSRRSILLSAPLYIARWNIHILLVGIHTYCSVKYTYIAVWNIPTPQQLTDQKARDMALSRSLWSVNGPCIIRAEDTQWTPT